MMSLYIYSIMTTICIFNKFTIDIFYCQIHNCHLLGQQYFKCNDFESEASINTHNQNLTVILRLR